MTGDKSSELAEARIDLSKVTLRAWWHHLTLANLVASGALVFAALSAAFACGIWFERLAERDVAAECTKLRATLVEREADVIRLHSELNAIRKRSSVGPAASQHLPALPSGAATGQAEVAPPSLQPATPTRDLPAAREGMMASGTSLRNGLEWPVEPSRDRRLLKLYVIVEAGPIPAMLGILDVTIFRDGKSFCAISLNSQTSQRKNDTVWDHKNCEDEIAPGARVVYRAKTSTTGAELTPIRIDIASAAVKKL